MGDNPWNDETELDIFADADQVRELRPRLG
jgi:hypothetical protein